MEIDIKPINVKVIKCPACNSEFDYREFIESENTVLKRHKALIKEIKEEYGEVFIDKRNVLLGKIKELEHKWSILIK